MAEKLAQINENGCSLDDIYFVGEQMWLGLTPGPINEAIAALRKQQPADTHFLIRLDLPEALHALPWEALYEKSVGSLAGAQNYCILHEPAISKAWVQELPSGGDGLRMLVIVPEGSGLNAEQEVNTLSRECAARDIEMRPLIQAVTPDRVTPNSTGGRWDMVHYVGHGRPNAYERIEIMLNAENGGDLWLDAEIFAQDFRSVGVRLAVMNCCFSHGSPERVDSLNGLGPLLMRQQYPQLWRWATRSPITWRSAFLKLCIAPCLTAVPQAGSMRRLRLRAQGCDEISKPTFAASSPRCCILRRGASVCSSSAPGARLLILLR